MPSGDLCEVSITAPDKEWLVTLCRTLVERRLAASANVVHPVTSVYRWDGTLEQTTEARAFLRSRTELLEALVAYVVEQHPFEVPGITAVPVIGGNPDYLAWADAQTSSGGHA